MFNSEIQEGRIALDDPEVAARMMLSTSHNLAFSETMGIEPTPDLGGAAGIHGSYGQFASFQ